MKIVVDEYPVDCSTCIFKEDNFSERKNHCTILHVDIGGINDVRFSYRCHDKFILFKDAMDKYLMEKDLEVLEKEADSLSRVEKVEKKRLSFVDSIGDIDKFNDDLNKLLQYGKENIEKGREGTIVIPKKEADNIIKRSEEEIRKQREEALDRASKAGFLDTGSVVSIGDEIRKVKDEVRKMSADIHHDNKVEDTGDKTLTKEQAAEMMCENFGGLV